ncbi:MAG: hypothetical protein WKF43_10115 [Acidimicrobiales bacterium]
MATFEVTMKDRTLERVTVADAYQQEGSMTTFFRSERRTVDSWSVRVASFRTAEILIVRRVEGTAANAETGTGGSLTRLSQRSA